jgi:hypothetical protein
MKSVSYISLGSTHRLLANRITWSGDGVDGIVYKNALESAQQVTKQAVWVFCSYSIAGSSGTREDYIKRNIRHFPTLILYLDGKELGRLTEISTTVERVRSWAKILLKH